MSVSGGGGEFLEEGVADGVEIEVMGGDQGAGFGDDVVDVAHQLQALVGPRSSRYPAATLPSPTIRSRSLPEPHPMPQPNWGEAEALVQIADGNYHTAVSHLLVEVTIMATNAPLCD
jgi:hypothetical protein